MTRGEQTRERILQAALGHFAAQSYAQTTMREIATTAGCSLGLVYHYYDSKEAVALAHYEALNAAMLQQMAQLPFQTLAERYVTILKASIARCAPQRSAIAALFASSLEEGQSPLAERLSAMRREMTHHFQAMVEGATDRPRDALIGSLGTLLATGHVLVMLFWLYDQTPQQRATYKLIDFIEDALKMLRPLLLMPIIGKAITKMATVLAEGFMIPENRDDTPIT